MERFEEFYPHLKKCTRIIETGSSIALEVSIDTKRHRYLVDHIFGEKCFVPATMIMEILMEAALWYTRNVLRKNEFIPVQINNIKIERAIAIAKGDSIVVNIDFQNIEELDGQVLILLKISSERKSFTGEKVGTRINTTGQVAMAKKLPDCGNTEIRCNFKEHYSIPQEVYYSNYFPMLGYLFNSCTGEIAFNKEQQTFCGVYNCKDKERKFIEGNDSNFLSSPLGNDACLQYAVFFSRILSLKGRLPIGGNEFRIYKKHPQEGCIRVVIKCLHIDDDVMIFDFYSFDDESIIVSGKEFVVKKSPYHRDFGGKEFFNNLNKYKENI